MSPPDGIMTLGAGTWHFASLWAHISVFDWEKRKGGGGWHCTRWLGLVLGGLLELFSFPGVDLSLAWAMETGAAQSQVLLMAGPFRPDMAGSAGEHPDVRLSPQGCPCGGLGPNS